MKQIRNKAVKTGKLMMIMVKNEVEPVDVGNKA
jgi:hypothetical protein